MTLILFYYSKRRGKYDRVRVHVEDDSVKLFSGEDGN